jgi:hypothetical protein
VEIKFIIINIAQLQNTILNQVEFLGININEINNAKITKNKPNLIFGFILTELTQTI